MTARAPFRRQIGLSVRSSWLPHLSSLDLDLVEVVADQWLDAPPEALQPVLDLGVPVMVHALGMNLGSVDGLDPEYADQVGALADRLDAACVSDHFAWRSVDGVWSSSFLPLPLRPEVILHVAARAAAVVQRLGRPLALETPSRYLGLGDTANVADALLALHEMAGSLALVDACNLRVSEANTGDPALELAERLAPIAAYCHVAGFTRGAQRWLDDHGSEPEPTTLGVADATGAPIVLEWDRDAPDVEPLKAVLQRLRASSAPPQTPVPDPLADSVTLPAPFDLHEWQRSVMKEVHCPTRAPFRSFHDDQVYGALALLEDNLPETAAILGPNFRWFVRELVTEADPCCRDVHGYSWIPAFVRFLENRPELSEHPRRPELIEEWHTIV